MRRTLLLSLLLLSLLLLPACATTSADAEWAAIQRARLERLHAARDPAAALLRVREQAPAAGAQSPQHIDQREPGRVDGPRPFRSALNPLRADLRVGAGNVGVRMQGTQLDDRADAWFGKASVDVASGSAIELDLWSSDGDLFAGRFVNDGVEPRPAAARVAGVGLFPHVVLQPIDGVFRLPVRLGAFGDWQQVDHQLARLERDYLSFGPRVVLEPTLRLLGDRRDGLELFTRFGGDVGVAWFEESFRGGESNDSTVRLGGELTGGLRLQLGALRGEAGYSLQHALYGDHDGELFGPERETGVQRQQVFFGFGITY
ncbi:MAG: hypothetical protein ACK501_04495 [Planctomycetota bacterium]|jgi:hypothetical protein